MIRITNYAGPAHRCWHDIAESCPFRAAIQIDTPLSRYWFCRFHLGMVKRGDLKPPRGEASEDFLAAPGGGCGMRKIIFGESQSEFLLKALVGAPIIGLFLFMPLWLGFIIVASVVFGWSGRGEDTWWGWWPLGFAAAYLMAFALWSKPEGLDFGGRLHFMHDNWEPLGITTARRLGVPRAERLPGAEPLDFVAKARCRDCGRTEIRTRNLIYAEGWGWLSNSGIGHIT